MTIPNSPEDKTDGNWNKILAVLIAAGFIVLLGMASLGRANLNFGTALGAAFLTGGASLAFGGFLGFLFGIPQAKPTTGDEPSDGKLRSYTENTNLEQISDWLTKIIVGLTLVQFNEVETRLVLIGSKLGPFFHDTDGTPIAVAAIIYFFLAGFLFAYLWTRIHLEHILRSTSARWNNAIERVQNQLQDDVVSTVSLDAELIDTVEAYFDKGVDVTEKRFTDLSEEVASASYGTRSEIYRRARRVRIENKHTDKDAVEKALTLFKALIAANPEKFPQNYSQLGRAYIFKDGPDYGKAAKNLEKALELQGAAGEQDSSTHMYLAEAWIMQDVNFLNGKETDGETQKRITASLNIAKAKRTLSKRKAIVDWAKLNKYVI